MSKQLIFALMFLGHFLADYTLQGWLADGKQRSWWRKLIPSYDESQYRFDHIVALVCHSLYWAIIICLPVYNHPQLILMIAINGVIHAIVDHLKCNKLILSLYQDQLVHAIQIVITFAYAVYY